MSNDWTPRSREALLGHIYAEGGRRRRRRRSLLTGGAAMLLVLLVAVPVVALMGDDPDTRVGTSEHVETTTTLHEETTTTTAPEETTTSTSAPAGPKPAGPPRTTVPPKPYTGELLSFQPHDGAYELKTSRPDGSDVRTIIKAPGPISYTAWSPDGRRVAYIVNGDELFVVGRDGRDPKQLTDGQYITEPAWHPNGRVVGFFAYDAEYRPDGVYTVDVDTGQRRRLLPDTNVFSGPSWSPDGRSLAVVFLEETDGRDGRFASIIDLATGNRRRVTNEAAGGEGLPAWSPDGKHIALAVANPDFPFGADPDELGIVPVDDPSKLVKVWTDSMANVFSIAWAPDSSKVAFTASGGRGGTSSPSTSSLYMVDRDGSGVHKVHQYVGAAGWAAAL